MVKNIKKYHSAFKYGKKVKDESEYSNEYINKRYSMLIKKGYSPEKAAQMIYFELGTSAIMRESIEAATAEECMMVGRLVGSEIGGTLGSLSMNPAGVGTGSFIGGVSGTYFGKAACNKIIKFASEKVVQKTSEQFFTKSEIGQNADIDITYISSYTLDGSKNLKNISEFKPDKAVKGDASSSNTLLKGGVTKNVYSKDLENVIGKRVFKDNDSYDIKESTFGKDEEWLKNHIYEDIEDDYERKARILEELKAPQDAKLMKVHDIVQNSGKQKTEEKEFDEKADHTAYINEVTKTNKIYTKEDISNMSEKELDENQQAIEYQKKTMGMPSAKQANASGMIFVSGYTRSDGIEVKSYYRARRA